MPIKANKKDNKTIERLFTAVSSGYPSQVSYLINSLCPAEIADFLESLSYQKRIMVWNLIENDISGEILTHVNDDVRASLIGEMANEDLVAATEHLAADDLADIFNDLPDVVVREVLHAMDSQNRHRLASVLSYAEDTAGGLMNPDTVTVRGDAPLRIVMRYIRMLGRLPDMTDSLYVVNRENLFLGILPLTNILTAAQDMNVLDVMLTDIEPIPANTSTAEVAKIFETHDYISAPVINQHRHLIGRITIDDVVDVIREEGEHSIMSMAGLDEDNDMFAPITLGVKQRAPWLAVNLLTAFLASWVIGLFGATIEQIVALAVLMPIVASMGGIAGSQTLTIVIRGIALGQVNRANRKELLGREIVIGLLNGILWSVVVGTVVFFWFVDIYLSFIIAAAIFLNLLVAPISGVIIPILLKKLGIDPALAGSVILTTITDVIGFLSFLGLATLCLL